MSKRVAPSGAECPICRHRFPVGITGWYSHITSQQGIDAHPNWHPNVEDPAERKRLFAKEFPGFFKDAKMPSRRKPPEERTPTAAHRTPALVLPAGASAPRFCSQCGSGVAQTDPPSKFCAQCGSPLPVADVSQQRRASG